MPLRIEPKTYFGARLRGPAALRVLAGAEQALPRAANERTFLAWLHMAVTLGGVGTALVGFTASEPTKEGECMLVHRACESDSG